MISTTVYSDAEIAAALQQLEYNGISLEDSKKLALQRSSNVSLVRKTPLLTTIRFLPLPVFYLWKVHSKIMKQIWKIP